jgi:uncharacterized protein
MNDSEINELISNIPDILSLDSVYKIPTEDDIAKSKQAIIECNIDDTLESLGQYETNSEDMNNSEQKDKSVHYDCNDISMETLDIIIEVIESVLKGDNICPSHDIHHFLEVYEHAKRCLARMPNQLNMERRIAVCLAALLHDVDDVKFFPNNIYYDNAVRILNSIKHLIADSIMMKYEQFINLVVEMISLVSTSKNKDSSVEVGCLWKLIPRYADRIEAVGVIGVLRCLKYCETIKLPLFTKDTLRITNDEELAKLITTGRYRAYKGKSASMIDHYYDKLLHITVPEAFPYLHEECIKRINIMKRVVFVFGKKYTSFNVDDIHVVCMEEPL